MVIKKAILSVLMLVGLLAGSLSLASPASASIGDCNSFYIEDGITLESCIFVDNSNGRATTTVRWNAVAPNRNVRPVATVQRGASAGRPAASATNNNCPYANIGGTGASGSVSCNAYIPNVSDLQAWRADSIVYVGINPIRTVTGSSATVYEA